MKEFLEYLDLVERNANSEMVEASCKLEGCREQRTLIQAIRNKFLNNNNRSEKVEDRDEPWNKLITAVKDAKKQGMNLPYSGIPKATPENIAIYQATLDMVLDLISECVPL